MTILCLVRDLKNGAWAAFADCLITSDENDEGASLRSPVRKNFMERKTFGFTELALEEKIGFVSEGLVVGWSGRRDLARTVVQAIGGRTYNDEIAEICVSDENCYFVAIDNGDGTESLNFFGREDRLQTIQVHGYEFTFAGSGSRILEGLRFTSKELSLGFGATDVVSAAIQAMSKFLSEEMAGQNSQFYSLRTGGHYQIVIGTAKGARRLRYCINHWHQGDLEPLVHSIAVPIIKDQHELFASIDVPDWSDMRISHAIGLTPLLQSPREEKTIQIGLLDALRSEVADFTFHVCWRKDDHMTFFINAREPQFSFGSNEFTKYPHHPQTLKMVSSIFGK